MIRSTVVRVLTGLALALGLLALSPGTSQASACKVTFHGQVGYKICGTSDQTWTFSNGTQRRFVIGLNNAVWNAVYYPSTGYVSSWQSLGGYAKVGVWVDRYVGVDPYYFAIETVGADNKHWCRAYQKNTWTRDWFRCH